MENYGECRRTTLPGFLFEVAFALENEHSFFSESIQELGVLRYTAANTALPPTQFNMGNCLQWHMHRCLTYTFTSNSARVSTSLFDGFRVSCCFADEHCPNSGEQLRNKGACGKRPEDFGKRHGTIQTTARYLHPKGLPRFGGLPPATFFQGLRASVLRVLGSANLLSVGLSCSSVVVPELVFDVFEIVTYTRT